MRTRFAPVLNCSAALLSLTFAAPLRAQAPGNVGRQVEGQLLNNATNAVVGQPAAVPAQPGAALPAQPGAALPATPTQALQGVERQAINNATSTVTGQPAATATQAAATRYQLPAQYANSAPGSTVNYNGTNYTINADGTMSPAAAAASNAARYQMPAQFAGSAPGSTVNYNGTNYVVNADGTMSPAAATALPTTPGQALQGMERQAINNATTAVTGQPAVSATRYQLPTQFAASAPGSTVNYGGANYTVNADGTMSPAATAAALPGQPAGAGLITNPRQTLQTMERQAAYTATNGVAGQPAATAARYQLPAQFAGSAPGSTVNYGGANYTVNADGTMSPAATAAQPAANAARYQIPSQFATSAPGTTINYGGTNYLINNDNTMSPAAR